MKKRVLAMLLAAVMVAAMLPTAFAVENQTANLTPEISAAYLHVIEDLVRTYGTPVADGESFGYQVYYGMCGGYIVDLGDGGYPEMIVAYSKKAATSYGIPLSFIRVYAWNGSKAVSVFEEQVIASGNGRSWGSYFLCQNGNAVWLDRLWEGLPSYDFVTGTYDDGWTQLDHLRLENGAMREFTSQAKETSSVQLGIYDNITFNNYEALVGELQNYTSTGFTDVPAGEWYAPAVVWAVEKDITSGTGGNTFSPGRTCTDIEILTFLWRAAGKPEAPGQTLITAEPYYEDFQKAVNFAYEKGMIDASFDSTAPCTRATAVKYIWQALDKGSAAPNSFSDVPADADYADAVSWAVANGVTSGTGNGTTFSPDIICDRSQIVTFLYRAYA